METWLFWRLLRTCPDCHNHCSSVGSLGCPQCPRCGPSPCWCACPSHGAEGLTGTAGMLQPLSPLGSLCPVLWEQAGLCHVLGWAGFGSFFTLPVPESVLPCHCCCIQELGTAGVCISPGVWWAESIPPSQMSLPSPWRGREALQQVMPGTFEIFVFCKHKDSKLIISNYH